MIFCDALPAEGGRLERYELRGEPLATPTCGRAFDRIAFAAAHVVADPLSEREPGVVFMAWLNGFQDHFVMIGGAQSMRPIGYFSDIFRLADQAGLLRDPELATARIRRLLAMYGVE